MLGQTRQDQIDVLRFGSLQLTKTEEGKWPYWNVMKPVVSYAKIENTI